MKDPTHPGTLITRPQVVKILQAEAEKHGRTISRQRVHVLEDHDDYPAPYDVLEDHQGRPLPVWVKAEIEEYAPQRVDQRYRANGDDEEG